MLFFNFFFLNYLNVQPVLKIFGKSYKKKKLQISKRIKKKKKLIRLIKFSKICIFQ